MAIQIKKAVKYDAKLRLALAGPSGSGKTYTALTLATSLAGDKGVCVIDTERGSASKYADLFSFDVIDLESFSPISYIEAIKAVEQAGYDVLVIDSLSHAWNGPGGLLEIVEGITKRNQGKSSFNAWGEATPLQNRLIDAITRSKVHVICTMRTKTEYVVEQNERGKSAPRKVGTAPVQRADVEYEFDVYADLDMDNKCIVHKSRCSALAGQVISKPDASVAETLKSWLSGVEAPPEAQKPQANLSDIPTAQKLRESAASLNIEWSTVLAETFERAINQKKITLQALIDKGDELSPDSCQRIASYLQAKQAA
jgi:hypothetical protein